MADVSEERESVRHGKTSAAFHLTANRTGITLSVDDRFWNDTICDDQGTTVLDGHIDEVLEVIRDALYIVATADRTPC